MCWFNKKETQKEKALVLLQKYVTEVSPLINAQLRNGTADANQVKLFDSLFARNTLPTYLYRWTSSQKDISLNTLLCDKAYLSCSVNVDDFINHVDGDDLTCYKIETNTDLETINVNALLPAANDEGEYILARSMQLKVVSIKLFQQNEFNQFLKEVHCDIISAKEMIELYNINSIRIVTASIQ